MRVSMMLTWAMAFHGLYVVENHLTRDKIMALWNSGSFKNFNYIWKISKGLELKIIMNLKSNSLEYA